jgi:thioredoxin 1
MCRHRKKHHQEERMSTEFEFTDANFDQEVLKSDTPVLVDFWAPWCGPCRMVAPIVAEISNEYAGKLKVGKVNTDDNQEVAVRYGIMSIPTLMIFKGGEVADRVVGALPKQALTGKIDAVLAG